MLEQLECAMNTLHDSGYVLFSVFIRFLRAEVRPVLRTMRIFTNVTLNKCLCYKMIVTLATFSLTYSSVYRN